MKKILVSGIVAAAVAVTGFASFAIANEKKELFDFKPFVTITAEQQEILKGKIKTDLDEMLAAGDITQEQYDSLVERVEKGAPCNMGGGKFGKGGFGKGGFGKGPGKFERPEMTEEQKAEFKTKAKENLKARLDEGKITQEEYDEQLAKIESGEFNPGFGRGPGKGNFGKGPGNFERPEMTEEQKAEMKAKVKENLKARLDEGKITQEEYDEQLAKIENGEFTPGFGRGPGRGNFGKGPGNFERPGHGKDKTAEEKTAKDNAPKANGKAKTKDAKKD